MRFILALLGAVLLTFAGISPDLHAADIKERTIKLPVVTAIDHPLGIGASKFAELVAQKSNGKMQVKVFPNGTLGGESPMISALQG